MLLKGEDSLPAREAGRGLASWRWERPHQSLVLGLLAAQAHGLGDPVPNTSGWFNFPLLPACKPIWISGF